MGIEALSDSDLLALKSGDLGKVSNDGLLALKSGPSSTPLPERPANLRQPVEPSLFDRLVAKLPTSGPVAAVGQHFVDTAAGMSGLMRGGANLLPGRIGDSIWPKEGSRDSLSRDVGGFLDPVGLAIGGGVTKVLPYVPVLGRGLVEGAKATGKNLFSGAVAGGTIGGLSEGGNTGEGAALGAGINVVLPPVLSTGAKVAGNLADALSGRLSDAKAAKILRDAAGTDIASLRAALAAAPKDLTAAQASAGIKNDVWNALDDLAKRADKESYFSRLSERQKSDVIDGLRKIAGGANQTEARQVAEASKRSLNNITTPMREAELGAANTAGTVGARLQGEADALGAAASGNVADVRRLEAAKQAADRVAQSGRGGLSAESAQPDFMPRLSGKFSYGQELSDLAERLSKTSADDSLILGEGARFKQMQVDSLAQYGLRPLESSGIVSMLNRQLADPKIGTSDINSKVIGRVRDKIAEWTNSGGVIDANALYGIRKSAVNETVEQLMGPADPKSKAKMAAGLLNRVKPSIDFAIERAGGTGWKNYLKTFEEGMTAINQQKMGAKALDLFNKQPNTLESLAAGNEPKLVEKIFKSEYDLRRAMGNKAGAIEVAASYLARERDILEGAARGKGGLDRVIEENISKFKLPNWINAQIAVTNRALSEIENRLNKSTLDKVRMAMKSGASANQLLSMVPVTDRIKVLGAILRGQGTIAGGIVSGSESSQTEPNLQAR